MLSSWEQLTNETDMKIKPEHLEYLKTTILTQYGDHFPAVVESYETGLFFNSDKCKDLQRRFCFDLIYGTELSSWVCDNLYDYLDDSHIFTALKSFCPTLTRRY